MLQRIALAVILIVSSSCSLRASAPGRRALLIGINDYSASRLPKPRVAAGPGRGWANLDGAVHDVEVMRTLLLERYGFAPSGIVTLTDQQATRAAILQGTRTLVARAKKGDIVFFFFSGHGSQVRNSESEEADRLDESLVPADSRLGAPDIRDKELRSAFNGILDRGASLTILLDACHSASGARGLDGGHQVRAIKPDLQDVADGSSGPRPEDRGALVLSAAQDFDLAYETLGDQGKIYGAFSWAFARAMRDAEAGEPASDTFLRARALLRAERPAQEPVLAGRAEVRLRPFLGVRNGRESRGSRIAVERRTAAGTYILQGGWVNGVTVGSQLRVPGSDELLEVTGLLGLAGSEGRSVRAVTRGVAPLPPGTLLEVVSWAAPPGASLKVWIPRAAGDIEALARQLRDDAVRRGMQWVDDPTETMPAHLVRWIDGAAEIVADGRVSRTGDAILAGVPDTASLFVQLPVPAALADSIGSVDGVQSVTAPQWADYILTGRLRENRVEYAWVRPHAGVRDRHSPLPVRTGWIAGDALEAALTLRVALSRIRRVHAWHDLASPEPGHYRLALRRAKDGALVHDEPLVGKSQYGLVLRAARNAPAGQLYTRYYYAFAIDSHGKSVLLFPRPGNGSVENRLPFTPTPGKPIPSPPEEIPLGDPVSFVVTPPYGIDTYFLLSTDEPLSTPDALQWDDARGTPATVRSPLEELLALTNSGHRGGDSNAPIRTPASWSIEKIVFESIPESGQP